MFQTIRTPLAMNTMQEEIIECLRSARALGLTVVQISKVTGASRQTVYNWIADGVALPVFRHSIKRIGEVCKTSETPKEAWGKLCYMFNLRD